MRLPPHSLAGVGVTAAAAVLFKREQNLQRSTERLAAAALETLLNAIDANDADTGAHVRRVAAYALVLSDALELPPNYQRLVEQVALFHDIGKIHEALFDILREGRKLTASERREILTHPERGAKVLEPLRGFYPELPAGVVAHHEKWNGQGYPKQLKGRRIPLCARIVTIADTFDAITYRRRYHNGQAPHEALKIILSGRGTQFDPELVDLFSFPPVFERILKTESEVRHWHAGAQRRTRREEEDVPEVTFRWRPAPGATRAQRLPGRSSQIVR